MHANILLSEITQVVTTYEASILTYALEANILT